MLELRMCEKIILDEIANKVFKRNSIALTYALAMMSSEKVDWAKINQAIVERWSLSGLEYIKKRAWKIMRGEL